MNEELVKKMIEKQHYDAFFYPPEIFASRVHEEKYRAHELSTSFCYVELQYDTFTSEDASDDLVAKTWTLLLQVLPKCLRGSDVRGYLADQKGIGIILLDCAETSIQTFFKRIRQNLAEQGLDITLNHNPELVKPCYFYAGQPEETP